MTKDATPREVGLSEGLGASADASADGDGDIALDWRAGDMLLSMSVAPTGRIAYAWTTPGHVEPHGRGTVHTHPALHEILKAVAARLSGAA